MTTPRETPQFGGEHPGGRQAGTDRQPAVGDGGAQPRGQPVGAPAGRRLADVELQEVRRRPLWTARQPLIWLCPPDHCGRRVDGVNITFLLTTLVVAATPGTGVIYTLSGGALRRSPVGDRRRARLHAQPGADVVAAVRDGLLVT